MADTPPADQLARRIADLALLRGQFTLRSGKTSRYYLDKYRFETQPDVLRALSERMAAYVNVQGEGPVDRIAGPELGAVALAASCSLASGKPFLLVRNRRKEYGSNKALEGVFEPGERVLLLEDVCTTGGQIVEAARTLEDAGLVVARIVGVVDRLQGARENIESAGYRFDALFTSRDLGIEPD